MSVSRRGGTKNRQSGHATAKDLARAARDARDACDALRCADCPYTDARCAWACALGQPPAHLGKHTRI